MSRVYEIILLKMINHTTKSNFSSRKLRICSSGRIYTRMYHGLRLLLRSSLDEQWAVAGCQRCLKSYTQLVFINIKGPGSSQIFVHVNPLWSKSPLLTALGWILDPPWMSSMRIINCFQKLANILLLRMMQLPGQYLIHKYWMSSFEPLFLAGSSRMSRGSSSFQPITKD